MIISVHVRLIVMSWWMETEVYTDIDTHRCRHTHRDATLLHLRIQVNYIERFKPDCGTLVRVHELHRISCADGCLADG